VHLLNDAIPLCKCKSSLITKKTTFISSILLSKQGLVAARLKSNEVNLNIYIGVLGLASVNPEITGFKIGHDIDETMKLSLLENQYANQGGNFRILYKSILTIKLVHGWTELSSITNSESMNISKGKGNV
jgi:hypothetical protein